MKRFQTLTQGDKTKISMQMVHCAALMVAGRVFQHNKLRGFFQDLLCKQYNVSSLCLIGFLPFQNWSSFGSESHMRFFANILSLYGEKWVH